MHMDYSKILKIARTARKKAAPRGAERQRIKSTIRKQLGVMAVLNLIKARDLRFRVKKEAHRCHVCDKHADITQLHHIVPLKEVAEWINTMPDVRIWEIKIPVVWLCPTCHVYAHAYLEYIFCNRDVSFELEDEEADRLIEMTKRYFKWIDEDLRGQISRRKEGKL